MKYKLYHMKEFFIQIATGSWKRLGDFSNLEFVNKKWAVLWKNSKGKLSHKWFYTRASARKFIKRNS